MLEERRSLFFEGPRVVSYQQIIDQWLNGPVVRYVLRESEPATIIVAKMYVTRVQFPVEPNLFDLGK